MPEEIMDLDDAIAATLGESGSDQADDEITEETDEFESTDDAEGDDDTDDDEVEEDDPEVKAAGMRQADYTRKTQQIAEERQALQLREQQLDHATAIWEALQEDPRSAILALNDHFADILAGDGPSPEAQRLAVLEARLQDQDDAALLQDLYDQCGVLAQEFDDKFDADALIQYAVDHEIPDLEAAYLKRAREAERAAGEKKRLKAKRTAPPVSGGTSRAAGTTNTPPDEIGSFDDAFNAALAEARGG